MIQEKIILDGKEITNKELNNLSDDTVITKKFSETSAVVGDKKTIKNITLEDIQNLDVPQMPK